MKFAFIQAEKAVYPVTVLCRVLGVSRAGFYAAQTRPVSPRATDDVRLATAITAIHAESRQCYGSPRVHAELRARGHGISRKRVARLMRRIGLVARRRRAYRATTQSRPPAPLAPNHLARQFTAPAPNRVWVTDITYLPTEEGWLYLAAVLDVFSRRIVGWATSARLAEGLTLEALTMSLARRRPRPGLLHHSDRGAHYASAEYRALLQRHGVRRSMSGAGACWDNAVAESFFATLKGELRHDGTWPTRAAARHALFDYIEIFYNGERRHSTLGHVSPVTFERQWHEQVAQ